jgi:hypothetical protein
MNEQDVVGQPSVVRARLSTSSLTRVARTWQASPKADTGPNSSDAAEWLGTGKGMGYGMLQDANAFHASA